MKTFLLFLLLHIGLAARAADMPYHPQRTVNGTNYNLAPLYNWRTNLKTQGNPTGSATREARPLRDWIGADPLDQFKVEEVWSTNLLLITWHSANEILGPGYGDYHGGTIVVKNHPAHEQVTDGQSIKLLALPVGRYQWTDAAGTVHTVPLYDYGSIKP